MEEIHIEIYADEIKYNRDPGREKFMYMGILLVETNKKNQILDKIIEIRESVQYQNELHFTGLKNASGLGIENRKTLLAEKYIDLILCDKESKFFYFDILGINLENLDLSYFGSDKGKHYCNIYNRFFRTIVTRSINSYFVGKKVIIDNIYHDNENSLVGHEYFNWHLLYKLNGNTNLRINFIDSDHNKEQSYKKESHFIQIIDLILGSVKELYDKPNKKKGCNFIGNKIRPLVERIRDKPLNRNSSYGYYHKYNISFFPKSSDNILLLEQEAENTYINKFYRERVFFNENQLSFNF